MKIKCALSVLLLTLIAVSLSKNFKKATPQGVDLQNHYGQSNIGSPYGPNTDDYAQFVTANKDIFTPFVYNGKKKIEGRLDLIPYPGMENKLNPHVIKSGDMTNIAPSAATIITPEIAIPKVHIQTSLQYPAVVKQPVFTGFRKEFHPVTAYDKVEHKLVHDKVLINKPNYTTEVVVKDVKRESNMLIDARSGARIENESPKVNHGIDSNKKK